MKIIIAAYLMLLSSTAMAQFSSVLPSGSIMGAPCTTGTCSPSALSATDFLFNPSTDVLTLGGGQALGTNGFATIQPAAASISGNAAYGVTISGGQNTNTAASSRAGGVIIEGGLPNVTSNVNQTGAVTIRTGTADIGVVGNFGTTGIVKIYSASTSTAGASSGQVQLASGSAPGATGNMTFTTGNDTATSGTSSPGNMQFTLGSNSSGATGAAGNYTFNLPSDANTSISAAHGSFLVNTGAITGVTSKQEYFTGSLAMSGGFVVVPSESSCFPCNADGQVVLSNANQSGGVAVDYQGMLELYSGMVDNNQVATYTVAISGTNCTSIANQKGGPTAGSFTVTTGAANAVCTIVLTIGQAASVPLTVTGWEGRATDITSGTVLPQFQASLSTTALTVKGTIATSGDLVTWSARGFH